MIVVDLSSKTIAGRAILVAEGNLNHDGMLSTFTDDSVSAYPGMGGQGVLPIPLVSNGWVQNLPLFMEGPVNARTEASSPINGLESTV